MHNRTSKVIYKPSVATQVSTRTSGLNKPSLNKTIATALLVYCALIVSTAVFADGHAGEGDSVKPECHELLNFSATKLRSSEQIDFCEAFGGKALLLVNTASQCGHTPQFMGLEKLHKEYGDQLAVVGFPSDDFKQEYSDSAKIADVCYVNYGVTFTMLEPSKVKGDNANPLFKRLAERSGEQPGWNFTKYLVSPDGQQVMHFSSSTKPNNKKLTGEIDKLIATSGG